MKVTLQDGSRMECRDETLGHPGADGAVYPSVDGRFVVKLYHQAEPWRPPSLEAILNRFNAVKGESYWEEVLCWPTALVRSPRLGVVMPRAAKGLEKLDKLTSPKFLNYHPEFLGTWHGRLGITIKLARAVRRLHFKGLCHSDLSGNNVLANATDGRMYVIDCDGLVVPGLEIARAVVNGTPGTMAPELVAGRVPGPSVQSDCHSLAVLIYQTLLLRHPLEGRKEHDSDPLVNDRLRFGDRALFIEHPKDASNRPERLPWPYTLLGAALSSLVEKAFISCLQTPAQRPIPAVWERDLVRLSDALVFCLNPQCTLKSFPLPENLAAQASLKCPWCGTGFRGFDLPVLHWLAPVPSQVGIYRRDGTRKVAWPDVTLHEWHIRANTVPGPNVDHRPLAKFHRSQDRQGTYHWFLINQLLPCIEVSEPGSPWRRVRTNEAVELKAGRKLRFGPPGLLRDAVVEVLRLV